ncbi:hypothetical protein H7849_23905 [Alloacidobacterium dinghuense]|uniref:Uncharacterized protein n=1 Tax=Alloacidobacterium dinghuense TaxID=2763107 RepID=A0A7G8BHK0_9BACT|nr:hypothetical protein [Alloacidobacterium dinghuense]QNI32020.1 hypothetical protein H7849_23905 [Alloacidobacterium dinghuense]
MLLELKLASSFLDIASHTVEAERRGSLCTDALKSYRTVIAALPAAPLSSTERSDVDQQLDTLRTRLERFGVIVASSDGSTRKTG